MSSSPEQVPDDDILIRLRKLEARVSEIEAHLNLSPVEEGTEPASVPTAEEREEALEIQIGQNWFAKAGILGIAVGIAFLLTFPYANIPPIIPSLVGYMLVGTLLFLSRLWRKSFVQISRYLLGGGVVLLYFATLRLAYFTPQPAVTEAGVKTLLLTLVVVITVAIALQRASASLTALSLLLGYLTALLDGNPSVVAGFLTLLAATTAYGFIRHQWMGVLLYGTAMTYIAHFVWAMNDPLLGNTLKLVVGPEPTVAFVLVYLAVLAFAGLQGLKKREESLSDAAAAVLNGGWAFLLLLVLTALGQQSHVAAWTMTFSVVTLTFAVAFWVGRRSTYATFVYAMLGYVALSVAIVDLFPLPDFFIWLCWESMLVLITAVWFRSRFIVLANFIVYLIVFVAFLFTAGTVSLVSISFGLVALLSARILNWQRERLDLKTEMMRNAYLGSALFVIPYALYHSLPTGFVSLSWLLVAFCYYLFSRLLKNRKYRWMALLTTIITILYVFLVDLVGVDPTLRIVSFLVLGTVLLATSMLYSRRRGASARVPPPADEANSKPPGTPRGTP